MQLILFPLVRYVCKYSLLQKPLIIMPKSLHLRKTSMCTCHVHSTIHNLCVCITFVDWFGHLFHPTTIIIIIISSSPENMCFICKCSYTCQGSFSFKKCFIAIHAFSAITKKAFSFVGKALSWVDTFICYITLWEKNQTRYISTFLSGHFVIVSCWPTQSVQ